MRTSSHEVDVGGIYRGLMGRSRPVWRWLAGGAMVSVVSTLVLAGQMYGVAYVLHAVFVGDGGWAQVQWPVAAVVGLAVLRALLEGLRRYLDEEAGQVMGDRLFEQLVTKTIAGDVSRRADTAWLTSAATTGVERIETFYARFVPRALDMMLVPITLLVVVAFADPFSAVVLLITAPLIPIFMVLIGKRAEKRTSEQWQAFERLNGHFLDSLRGVTTLQVFGRLKDQPGRLAKSAERLRERTMSVLKVAFLSSMILELAASVSTAVIAVEIGVRLVEGWMEFLPGLFVLLVTPEFYMAFRRFGSEHHAGMEAAASAAPILELLEEPQTSHDEAEEATYTALDGPPAIDVEELMLQWPEANREVFSGLSLHIPASKLTVIRAPSGWGKSTLAAALTGRLQPLEGRILWDGDCRRPSVGDIAFASQRPYLFATSVAQNLRVARPDADTEQLWEVLRQVGLAETVQRLPAGLETDLAEAGQSLSGGERHRLAIARALLRTSPVVILDEPSAQLDAACEQQLIEALRRRCEDATVVVFSHRRAFWEAADHGIDLVQRVRAENEREVA